MKNFCAPVALVLCVASSLSHAANADLTLFSTSSANFGSVTTTQNNAELTNFAGRSFALSAITGVVAGATSFDWYYIADSDTYGDIYIHTGPVTILASSIFSITNSGWNTYSFSAPYSGTITFAIESQLVGNDAAQLDIRNLVVADPVSPVPEPESYAMLMAGLGLMGVVARRKYSSTQKTIN